MKKTDQSDILIRNLKAENEQLRVVDANYQVLNKRLIELERQFIELQEGKKRNEREFKEWMATNMSGSTQVEFQSTEAELIKEQEILSDIKSKLNTHTSLINDKDSEIEKLCYEQTKIKEHISKLLEEKNKLETELETIKGYKLNKEKDGKESVTSKEELRKNYEDTKNTIIDINNSKEKLKKVIYEAEIELALNERKVTNKRRELEDILINNINNNKQVKVQNTINSGLINETEIKKRKIEEIKEKLEAVNEQHNEAIKSIIHYDKEIKEFKEDIKAAQSRTLEAEKEVLKLKIDNEIYMKLLQEYKINIESQRRLKELETAKKYEAEQERNEMEKTSFVKEIEKKLIILELEQVKDNHNKLLEDKVYLVEDVDALKKHTELLEIQNNELHKELEQFVETDERVRRELSLRKKLESPMKSKDWQSPHNLSITKASFTHSP